MATKWVLTEEQAKSQAKKSTGSVKKFVDLKKNQSMEITHLDEDGETPPILKVMKIFAYTDANATYPSYVLCPASPDEPSVLVDWWESLDEGQSKDMMKPTNYYCYSVLTREEDDKGEMYPAAKQVRLVSESQVGFIKKKFDEISGLSKGPLKDINGLFGETFVLSRGDEKKAARIGEIGSYVETPNLSELHDDPKAFTTDELIEMFETDLDDMQAYVDRMNAGNDTRPVINR